MELLLYLKYSAYSSPTPISERWPILYAQGDYYSSLCSNDYSAMCILPKAIAELPALLGQKIAVWRQKVLSQSAHPTLPRGVANQ